MDAGEVHWTQMNTGPRWKPKRPMWKPLDLSESPVDLSESHWTYVKPTRPKWKPSRPKSKPTRPKSKPLDLSESPLDLSKSPHGTSDIWPHVHVSANNLHINSMESANQQWIFFTIFLHFSHSELHKSLCMNCSRATL